MKKFSVLILPFLLIVCSKPGEIVTIKDAKIKNTTGKVRTGLDILLTDHFNSIRDMNIALITNTLNESGEICPSYDSITSKIEINLKKVFHFDSDWVTLQSETNRLGNGISIHLIDDAIEKTSTLISNMTSNIDAILIDVQDIGSRNSIYLSNLIKVLSHKKLKGLEVIILDRPNPLGGQIIEGPILDSLYEEVDMLPIPNRHGLTTGELFYMAIHKKMLVNHPAKIVIIKMDGWERQMFYSDTKLPWIFSNLGYPDIETILLKVGLELFEGLNLSNGTGTYKKYKQMGAPWMSFEVAKDLKEQEFSGVNFKYVKFIPDKGLNKNEKTIFDNKLCIGHRFEIESLRDIRAMDLSIYSLYFVIGLHIESLRINNLILNEKFGNEMLSDFLNGKLYDSNRKSIGTPEAFLNIIRKDHERFISASQAYNLY